MDDIRFDKWSLAGAVVKLLGGAAIVVFLFDKSDHFWNLADEVYYNSAVAVNHAVADGRANLEFYTDNKGSPLPDDVPLPTSVPHSDAAVAVAADQTVMQLHVEMGHTYAENARWLQGGAGAVALLAVRNFYNDVSRGIRSRQKAVQPALRPSRIKKPSTADSMR